MNRIDQCFKKDKKILSVFFTAGHPTLNSVIPIMKSLQNAGADMIELGIPFSDPLADGPVIQASNEIALDNGMSIKLLFEVLKDFRKEITIPVLLMGYLNPVMQYGFEKFCKEASDSGIDGLILPDLPLVEYDRHYKLILEINNLYPVFLITPVTNESRIREISTRSKGFLYMVSSSSTTGAKSQFPEETSRYFERVRNMDLDIPLIAGFGISDRQTFESATRHTDGAIIGSAFVQVLNSIENETTMDHSIMSFIRSIKE